jgi:glutathione S-transferase
MLRVLIAPPSPFARKVRIALREKRLPHEELVDNPWLADSGVAMRNPLGKVPVLMLDDGRMLHDSAVII